MVETGLEVPLHERDIETFAVVGHQDAVVLDIVCELMEVPALNIGPDRGAVIEGDRRYLIIAPIKARGFDIDVGG